MNNNTVIAGVVSAFFVIGFLIYGSTIGHNFVEFDDTLLVIDNISVITAGSVSAVSWAFAHYDPELYIPLTFLSFQLDAVIGGLNPWIFHLDNVIQHIINGLLMTWILQLLFKRIDVAVLLGLLFLLHPLNTEAVSWVSGRKDLLSTLFALLSIVLYLRHATFKSAGAFVLGILAKISVAPVPFALMSLDSLRGERVKLRSIKQKTWYFIPAITLGLIAILGKDQVLGRSSFVDIVLLIPRTIIFYCEKLLLPFKLSILYPYDPTLVTLTHPPILISFIVVAACAIVIWMKRRRYPCLFIGSIIALLFLTPSFFQYYRGSELYLATDRYMYMPFIGVLIALAPLLTRFVDRFKNIAYGTCIAYLVILSFLSFERSQVWENTYTLFADSLEKHESFGAYEKVGAWLLREGETAEAVEALRKSIELSPNSAAYFRLGVAAMQADNIADAKLFTQEALRLSPENPQAHVNMSKFYWDEGNQWLALDHAEKAVEYHPWNMMALGNLATIYTLSNRKSEALTVINVILELDPDNERVKPLLKKLRN